MSKNWRGEISFPVGEIYKARLALRITTQALLAEQAGVRREIVVDAERGMHISAEHAKAIARHVKLDLSNFLDEEDYGGLIGRNIEVTKIMRALDAQAPVRYLVMGGPGIGKTACTGAIANVARTAHRYDAQRIWFVPLGTANNADGAKHSIITALGLDPAAATFDDAMQLTSARPGLLILDNLETPWEGDSGGLTELLCLIFRGAPQLAILASIRGRESPAAAWSAKLLLAPLSVGASSKLFRSVASLISQRDPHLGPFLAALGGMPLAIKLVAQRAEPYDSLARYWEEWNQYAAGISLAANPQLPEDRQTSVLRSVDFSLRSSRLTEAGRRLFRLLGRAPAGMALSDCGAFLGTDARAAERQLLAVGLAEQRPDRLDLLPPVRDAARVLAPLAVDEELEWCAYYIQLVNDNGPLIGRRGGREAAALLAPETSNIESALLASAGNSLSGNDLLSAAPHAISGAAKLISYIGTGSSNLLVDLANAFELQTDLARMAQCLAQFSDHAVRRSEYDVAEKMYNRIIPVFIGLGDRASTAHCLEWLSDVAREREDYKQAGEFCTRAITAYQEATAHGQLADGIDSTKIELGLADALWSQGELRRLEQQWNEACANYKSAYLYFELHHSLRGQANCFRGLGYVALGRTDHVGALTFFLRAQKIYEEIGLPLGHGKCLYGIGKLHHSCREFDLALRHYEPALNFFQRLRNGRLVELCRARIAAAQNSEDVSNIQL